MGWAKYEEDNREIMEERLDNMWSLSWREMVGHSESRRTQTASASNAYPIREYKAKAYPAA